MAPLCRAAVERRAGRRSGRRRWGRGTPMAVLGDEEEDRGEEEGKRRRRGVKRRRGRGRRGAKRGRR